MNFLIKLIRRCAMGYPKDRLVNIGDKSNKPAKKSTKKKK